MVLKSPAEIEIMDHANQVVRRILAELGEMLRPGMTTRDIDRHAEDRIRAEGLASFYFQGYQPAALLSDSLAAADVHFVSLLPALEGLIVPSKVYGILAAGRPAVFVGDPAGDVVSGDDRRQRLVAGGLPRLGQREHRRAHGHRPGIAALGRVNRGGCSRHAQLSLGGDGQPGRCCTGARAPGAAKGDGRRGRAIH